MSYVYMLRCRDGSLYTGYAEELLSRVRCHNRGKGARYTRGRRPVTLVYAEWKDGRAAALRREAELKALPREKKLRLCCQWARTQNKQT